MTNTGQTFTEIVYNPRVATLARRVGIVYSFNFENCSFANVSKAKPKTLLSLLNLVNLSKACRSCRFVKCVAQGMDFNGKFVLICKNLKDNLCICFIYYHLLHNLSSSLPADGS
jgi:hypothetical protein